MYTFGDMVLATDPVTGDTSAELVIDLISGAGTKELVSIGTDPDGDGVLDWITATDGHPFWVARGGWVNAGNLVAGDLLMSENGELIAVHELSLTSRVAVVYNLTIDELHTYYTVVGWAPVLVHNITCADGGPLKGYTRHGLNQAISREGKGVSPGAILNALKSPSRISSRISDRGITFVGRSAKVVMNPSTRKIVTVIPKNRGGLRLR